MRLLKTADATVGLTHLQHRIITELMGGKKVLWLIPGGSNIPGSVQVMAGIPTELTANLTLALTDERYGEAGHSDSNWFQLESVGFDVKQAQQFRVLQATAQSLEGTSATYARIIKRLLDDNDVVIGQFGMGPDGHIAGILPNSPAVGSSELVAGYKSATFERITLTFAAIQQCSAIFLFAFGAAKKPMLENLQSELALNDQPAQIIKDVADSVVYNDQIGEEV